MDELLKPSWGAEQWINEGWNTLSFEEQKGIQARLNTLFQNGLPFELKHDKLLYCYLFSLLAQLEVLAIQVPLRFEKEMPNEKLKKSMRSQLLDEIFHGMVFTKVAYMLSTPYGYPPIIIRI